MRILNQIKRKNPVETSVQTLARKRRTPILFFILPLPGLIALLMFSYLPMMRINSRNRKKMTKGARREIVRCEQTDRTLLRDLPSQ